MKEDTKEYWRVSIKMAEIYLSGAEITETDKLSLKDFIEKVELSSDIKFIDTIGYGFSNKDYRHFNVWITLNDVPCVCGITTYDDGKCKFYLTYINGDTLQKINMTYVGESGYAASIFILRAKLWASKNRGIFKAQRFPEGTNDELFAGEEKTII